MPFQTTLTPELIERSTDQRHRLGGTITDYLDETAQRTTLLWCIIATLYGCCQVCEGARPR